MKQSIIILFSIVLIACNKEVTSIVPPVTNKVEVVNTPVTIKTKYSTTDYDNTNLNGDWSELSGPETYQWADINSDGILDKIIIHNTGYYFAIYDSNKKYQWVDASQFLLDYTPSLKDSISGVPGGEQFSIVDLNNDSIPDFVINQSVEKVVNAVDLGYNYLMVLYSSPIKGKYYHKIINASNGSIAVADINGDGVADITNVVQTSGKQNLIRHFLMNRDITYKEVNFNVKNPNDDKVNLYAQDFSYYNDFDKDGKPDLITYGVEYGDSANQGERQKFGPTIWFNTTPNGYSTYTLLHDNAFYRKYQGFGKLNMTASMVIYDYDNDGYKDVILNNINANGSPYKDHNALIIVWKNLGNGQFKNVTENVFNVGENINIKPNGETYQKIRVIDVDGDGSKELCYENLNCANLYYKYMNGKFVKYTQSTSYNFNSLNFPTYSKH